MNIIILLSVSGYKEHSTRTSETTIGTQIMMNSITTIAGHALTSNKRMYLPGISLIHLYQGRMCIRYI